MQLFRTSSPLTFGSILITLPLFVNGHGHLIDPSPSCTDDEMLSHYSARIPDPNVIFKGGVFPESGTKANYEELIVNLEYNTLSVKDIINQNQVLEPGATAECGFTDPTKTSVILPETLKWGKNEGTDSAEGFRPTHLGPCEAYCDNERVMRSLDCTEFNKPDNKGIAEFKLESPEMCVGKKIFTFYWLTTQAADEGGFQVYTSCVGLDTSVDSYSTESPSTDLPEPGSSPEEITSVETSPIDSTTEPPIDPPTPAPLPETMVPTMTPTETPVPLEKSEELEKQTPEQEIPDQVAPEEEIPDQVAPEEEIPDQVAPEEEIPDQVAPEEESPEQLTPEEESSEQVTPGEETPAQVKPEEETSEEETTDQETPEEAYPEEETPEQVAPEETSIEIPAPKCKSK